MNRIKLVSKMRKVVSFMHLSLDGFVAGENGEMDWLLVDEEMFDFAGERTNQSDTAVYGRVTYELMDNYWPTAAEQPNASKHDREHSQWYNNVEKVVISKTIKGKEIPNTTIISENLAGEILKLKNRAGKEIILFGSPTITHLLTEERLIDDYWLFVNPILLGKGIRLFKNLSDSLTLKLLTSKTLASGVICLHYEATKVNK